MRDYVDSQSLKHATKTSIWFCEACGADGTVTYQNDERVLNLIRGIVREHDTTHPHCHRRVLLQLSPTSSMRVPSRDVLTAQEV